MRVLFVAPYVPSLIRVRPYNFIRFLAAQGHQITVVALGADGHDVDKQAAAALGPFCSAVHVVPLDKRMAAMQCLWRLATPTPLWAAYCHSRPLESTLREVLARDTYDIAHVEHLRAAHFGSVLEDALPLVFDAVDCLTDLQRQLMRTPGRNALARAVSWGEQAKLRAYEPRLAARYDRVLVTSPQDAEGLQSLAAAQQRTLPIDVVPNGVDLDYFCPQPAVPPTSANLILSGKMSYAANHDAAVYFVQDIFPLIRHECPAATLTIAGSGPTRDLLALAARPDSGITITGRVDDLRPHLARAAVAVCPLRVGVGIQNKVLEAMAMGKAVVTTPLAARALNGAQAESLRVADTPAAFATSVLHLLDNPAEARQIGQSARQYVEAHHDWNHVSARVGDIYRRAITGT